MFAWRSAAPGPVRAFTDRHDGVSAAPFAGFNLGAHVGDDAADVATHRARLDAEIGAPVLWADQVHGTQVIEITEEVIRAKRTATGAVGAADALVTRLPGIALGVLVADCTPVLLHDDHGMIGVAHAGRAGMTQGVVRSVVTAMRGLGAGALYATIGPSICGRCYEVPSQMRAEAAAVAMSAAAVTRHGTPAIDVAAGVVEQLTEHDVSVQWVPGCTAEDTSLYSYRRDGVTGRFAGVIGWPQ